MEWRQTEGKRGRKVKEGRPIEKKLSELNNALTITVPQVHNTDHAMTSILDHHTITKQKKKEEKD